MDLIAFLFKTDWAEKHLGNDAPPPELAWGAAAFRYFFGINALALDLEVRFKLRNDGKFEKFYEAGREETAQDSMWALVKFPSNSSSSPINCRGNTGTISEIGIVV